MTAYEKRKANLAGLLGVNGTAIESPPVQHTCTSHIKNFRLCGEPAIYRDLAPNKLYYEYYCEHCARVVQKWGHTLEPISPHPV